ncbi:MAG TPA: DNA polymerase III subunit gamma/tau, partial [Flavisolibacter sp.]
TALQLIAQKSEGCMRDALSILDKIVSFTNGEVTYENTIEHLNILDADYYFKLIHCMLEQDLAGAMLLYDDIDKKGFEGDMVLNGFSEFVRNLLICKDERVAGLLEVVESFKQRYVETAKRTEAAYLVSALNILNESEIGYRSARNKRLHVELALIKLCYLQQALQLTSTGAGLDKKKLVDTPKSIPFRNIQPIAVVGQKNEPPPQSRTKEVKPEAKLIIETPEPVIENKKTEPVAPEIKAIQPKTVSNGKAKLGSLDAIRQKIQQENCSDNAITDQPLEITSLRMAWEKYIEVLKSKKNPAWQSFEVAELEIKDPNSFEAIVNNNINQKFLDFERNKVSEFLQKELCNRLLQFGITIKEGQQEQITIDLPLSSKEQYQKLVEQYPLVKELKDRLRLELDY